MKYIKIFILTVILIFLIIFCYLINFFSNTNNSSHYDKISTKINEYLNEYKEYSIDIFRSYDGIIYGNILTDKYDSILFSTYATFSYDINNDIFSIQKVNDNKRIIDYIELDTIVIYCTLENNSNNNSYIWKIEMKEPNKSSETLLSGEIINVFDYPVFNYIDKNNIFISTKKNIENSKINYSFFTINKENRILEELISEEGNLIENAGTLLNDSESIIIDNNKIYYSITNADNTQSLLMYDLKNNEIQEIYKCSNDNMKIYNFIKNDKYMFVQLIDSNSKDNESNIIILNNELQIERNFESLLLTFPVKINNNEILFHNFDGKWKYFSFENIFEDIKDISIYDEEIFPKYFLIDENIILIQNFNNNLNIVDINNI